MANNPFLEERLSLDVRMGASYGDEYSVEIVKTRAKAEHRTLVQPFPERHFSITFTDDTATLWSTVLALYHRAYGMYAGFRVKCLDDYTTNGNTTAPTSVDQTLDLISTGIYQLRKEYGAGATPIALGLPERTIYKPVTGTTLIAVGSAATAGNYRTIQTADYTVDTVTGQVTFDADKTKSITAISKAASAVITVGASHGFTSGESVHVSSVAGMTQINGKRGLITGTAATTITVDIDSTAFSTYTSGGAVHTRPQSGEIIYGGCEFDLPCRFNSRVDVSHAAYGVRESDTIDLIELISP